MTRRVMPREALEAESGDGTGWTTLWLPLSSVDGDDVETFYTDAEFAEAFVDAGLYEAVIEAARAVDECAEVWLDERIGDLHRALRAFDEGHKPVSAPHWTKHSDPEVAERARIVNALATIHRPDVNDDTDQDAHLEAGTCNCHDSWDQCPCAEGGHVPGCDCCPLGSGLCGERCAECGKSWPCPTMRVVKGKP